MRTAKKGISLLLAAAMIAVLFTGFVITGVSAVDTEKIYNISDLTAVPSYKGDTLFDGAVAYSAGEAGSLADIERNTITTPGGQYVTVSKTVRTKKISVTVTLEAGETVVEYYRGTDSGGSGKDISMTISDESGSVVATESNTENKNTEISAIAYKSETGGKYTIVDTSTGTNRTELYAIVITPYEYRGTGSELPPSEISELTAEAGDGMVSLTWNPVPGAETYSVYVDGVLVDSGLTETSYVVAGLTNGTEYSFKLEAVNSAGSTNKTVTATPFEPTEAPGEFTVSGTSKDKAAALYWTSARYAKSYDVYRDEQVIAENLTALSYEDKNLTNGTEYTYKITAKNSYGSVDSNTVSVTPLEPPPSAIEIVTAKGWLESTYVTWKNAAPVDKYNVYVKPAAGGEYTKLDDQLVRYYGSYYRADAVGLPAGEYQMKVAAVIGGSETDYIETNTLTVTPHKREGFAFNPSSPNYNSEGIGAYKNDGSLKDGAQVLYIDDSNKDTVTHTVMVSGKATEATGLVNILALREKNGAETTPLVIRMIGQVESPEGKNSSGYVQLKSCENITLEGIGDDATTYHWSLLLREATNVEVRNIAVMEFYDDGISLDTKNYNCWVHNCDIFYGQDRGGDQKKGDGSLDVKSGSDYCTFSYNHFWDSGKSSLCGMKDDSYMGYHITYHHNWFDHSDSRHPRVRGDQVHVYNNYYDGNSKYGVGSTTGSSIFVEANVFRNVKYPILTSMQGSDVAGTNEGTFSGENGGVVKEFNNMYISGSQSHDVVGYDDDPIEFDAYKASSRNEEVPAEVVSKAGGSSYSNFDTAATMYSYTPDPVENVAFEVQTYAGRIEGGDFRHEFNDEVDDLLYDRDPVLGKALQEYKSTIVTTYTSAGSYPSTEGEVPQPRPTVEPVPTVDPNAPTATPKPTTAPVIKAEANTVWNFGEEPFTVTEGESKHPHTQYFPAGGTDAKGNQRYSITSTSITAEKFGGLTFKTSGTLEDQYQSSSKTFEDGFEGTWQLKSGGAGSASDKVFTFIPAEAGKVTVYARSGSSTKDAKLTISQGTNTSTLTLVNTASEAANPPILEMVVTAGEPVKIYSDGNTGYYGIVYSGENLEYNIASASAEESGSAPKISAAVEYTGTEAVPPEGRLIAVKYSSDGFMTDFAVCDTPVIGEGVYEIENFAASDGEKVKLFIWSGFDNLVSLSRAFSL